MDWSGLADAFVAVMQAISLGMLCCGAVISIREGFDAEFSSGSGRAEPVLRAQRETPLAEGVNLDGTR